MTPFRLFAVAAIVALGFLAGCSRTTTVEEETGNRLLRNAAPLFDRGLLSAARDSALQALAAFQRVGANDGAASAEQFLGDIAVAEASFSQALAYYTSATGHFRSTGDRIGARAVTLSMMDLYTRMGREEEAFNVGEEAFRLAQVARDTESIEDIGDALLPLARTLARDDMEAQLLAGEEQVADSARNKDRAAWLQDQEGLNLLAHDDAADAALRFAEARDIALQNGDTALAIPIMLHLGGAFERNGNFTDAIATYLSALPAADRPNVDRALKEQLFFRTGNALVMAKRNDEAIRYFQSALAASKERGDELGRRCALLQVANALRPVDVHAAMPIVRQALDGLDDAAPPSLVAFGYGTDGLCSLAANQPVDALAAFQRAVDAAESEWSHNRGSLIADCQRAVIGTGRTPWHDETVDLLMRMGRNDEALTYALRRSAWLLYRDVDRIHPEVADTALQRKLDRWHALRADCNGAEEQLRLSWSNMAGAREQAAGVAQVLRQRSSDAQALAADIIGARKSLSCFVTPQPIPTLTLQRSIPDGTQLVLYGSSSRSLQMFVIGRQTIIVHSLAIDRGKLAARCAQYAAQLSMLATGVDSLTEIEPRVVSKAVVEQGSALYEIFVRPVERDLRRAQVVLIAEEGEFPFVPIGALRRNGTTGSSIFEQHPMVYVLPSMLPDAVLKNPIVNKVVAFGAAGTSGRDAEYEMRDIKVTFKDAEFRFDKAATLDVLTGERADLAHLVFDVHWDISRPANSYIPLYDPAAEVLRQLPVGDFLKMPPFPAVALYNLSPAYVDAAGRLAVIPFAAGAKTVILNCAGTGRKSTKNFVDIFSTELRSAKGVSEAYRSAMLKIIARPDCLPVYWQPFTLWVD